MRGVSVKTVATFFGYWGTEMDLKYLMALKAVTI